MSDKPKFSCFINTIFRWMRNVFLSKRYFLKICYWLIPCLILTGCVNYFIANHKFSETMDAHQQSLCLMKDSILKVADKGLLVSGKDSLKKVINQGLAAQNSSKIVVESKADQRNIMVVATLNLQMEGLIEKLKDTSDDIKSCGKWFFDSNTVTFLITLVVTLLLTLFFESQKEMRDLKDEIKGIPRKYVHFLDSSSRTMDLYAHIMNLHNTSIIILHFFNSLNVSSLNASTESNKKSIGTFFPELYYQMTNTIDDIVKILDEDFLVNEDIFNSIFKTLESVMQNLDPQKVVKDLKNDDLSCLIDDIRDQVKDLQEKIVRHQAKAKKEAEKNRS